MISMISTQIWALMQGDANPVVLNSDHHHPYLQDNHFTHIYMLVYSTITGDTARFDAN